MEDGQTVASVTPADWTQSLPLSPTGPPWLNMGVSRVGEDQWLIEDDHYLSDMAQKRLALETAHDEVFQVLEDSEEACCEVLDLIRGKIMPKSAEKSWAWHPLEQAARLVQEDLCIIQDGIFTAGCICFPSHWRLKEKIGKTVAELHGPVPMYDTELASRVNTFMSKLPKGAIFARRNFAIHEFEDLTAPNCPPYAYTPPSEQWLRSEYETMRRLDKTDAILFTIRTQQMQLKDVDSQTLSDIASRIEAEPEGLIDYRNLQERKNALLTWMTCLQTS